MLSGCRNILSSHRANKFGEEMVLEQAMTPIGLKQSYAAGNSSSSCGREEEYDKLKSSFLRASSGGRPEIVLVMASSGMGKSYFVNTSIDDLIRSSNFSSPSGDNRTAVFISGKCNEINKNRPYSCMLDAVTMLCDRIQEMDSQAAQELTAAILKSVECNGRVLTDLFSKLEVIMGRPDPVVELSGKENKNRLHRVFRCFLRAITSFMPLVIHLDDLQWVDEASLDLVHAITTDSKLVNLLLVGSYRDDGVNSEHILLNDYFDNISKHEHVPLTRIVIGPLKLDYVTWLTENNFGLDSSDAESLACYVYKVTGGNALFVVRLLEYLRKMQFVKISKETSRWEWDEALIDSADIPTTPEDVIANEIDCLPPFCVDFLKRAAMLGFYFDNVALKKVIAKANFMDSLSDIPSFKLQRNFADSLGMATKLGYLQKVGVSGYQFCHDKVWEAVYGKVPESKRNRFHLEIGRVLMNKTESGRMMPLDIDESRKKEFRRTSFSFRREDLCNVPDRHLCLIVDQLNRGRHLVKTDAELSELISLNLQAAAFSMKSAATKSAMVYLTTGIELLDDGHWNHQYEYSLELYNSLAEAALFSGDYDLSQRCTHEVLEHGKTADDKYQGYLLTIRCLKFQKRADEAILFAKRALNGYGVSLKFNSALKLDAAIKSLKLKRALRKHDVRSLSNLPPMTDERKLKAMKICEELYGITYGTNNVLYHAMAQIIVKYTLSYGVCDESIGAFLVLAQVNFMPEKNGEFAQTGLALMERLNAKKKVPQVKILVHGYIRPWISPITNTLDELQQGNIVGTQLGNVEYAAYCGSLMCSYSYFSGESLNVVEGKMRDFMDWMFEYKLFGCLRFGFLPCLQAIKCLQGHTDQPWELTGEEMNLDEALLHAKGCPVIASSLDVCRLELFCLYHKYNDAAKLLLSSLDVLSVRPSHFSGLRFTLYEFIASNELARLTGSSAWRKRSASAKKKIINWANTGNVNCRHMFPLVKAETARTEGKISLASKWYGELLDMPEDGMFPQDKAYFLERAGIYFREIGKRKKSEPCFLRARALYEKWGGVAKLEHIG